MTQYPKVEISALSTNAKKDFGEAISTSGIDKGTITEYDTTNYSWIRDINKNWQDDIFKDLYVIINDKIIRKITSNDTNTLYLDTPLPAGDYTNATYRIFSIGAIKGEIAGGGGVILYSKVVSVGQETDTNSPHYGEYYVELELNFPRNDILANKNLWIKAGNYSAEVTGNSTNRVYTGDVQFGSDAVGQIALIGVVSNYPILDNINTTLTNISSDTSNINTKLDTTNNTLSSIDTNVSSIKAKTDNLSFDVDNNLKINIASAGILIPTDIQSKYRNEQTIDITSDIQTNNAAYIPYDFSDFTKMRVYFLCDKPVIIRIEVQRYDDGTGEYYSTPFLHMMMLSSFAVLDIPEFVYNKGRLLITIDDERSPTAHSDITSFKVIVEYLL